MLKNCGDEDIGEWFLKYSRFIMEKDQMPKER